MTLVICSKGHQGTLGARFCQQCGESLSVIKYKKVEVNSYENEDLVPRNWLRDR